MKRTVAVLCLFVTSIIADSRYVDSYLAPYGPWELCPVIPWTCASTTVNEYILGFYGNGKAEWYSYVLLVNLQGQSATLTYRGSFIANDNQFGWDTTLLVIPGVVVAYSLSVTRGDSGHKAQ